MKQEMHQKEQMEAREDLVRQLDELTTEQRNPRTLNIAQVSSYEMMQMFNRENEEVTKAIEPELAHIAEAVDCITAHMKQGGRLFYIGAGTSGRLGILDASECPPTYSVAPDRVIGLIAGGDAAIRSAVENAEDSLMLAEEQLKEYQLCENDVVCGITASGRTPYVIGGLKYAQSVQAATICVTNNQNSETGRYSDIAIEAVTGPEPVTGSTRMKAGSAQKMILNMLSTGTMIQQGRTDGNLMTHLQVTNEKLAARMERMNL